MNVYNEIFLRSWKNALKKYSEMEIKFITEADLQSHVFSECINQFETENMEKPYKIHVNKSIFSPRQKTDLVLGDADVAVEFKFEPDYPGVSKPVAFREEIEKDIVRVNEYIQQGVKYSHFAMIDEDGFHRRNPRINEGWSTIDIEGKESFYLLISKE